MSKKKKELYKNHVTPKEMEFISDSCVDTIRKHIRNGDIKAKCINAYSIYIANRLQRHTQNDINEMKKPFQNLNLRSQTFSFVLIIKEHKTDWLSPISDSLKQRIKVFLKF